MYSTVLVGISTNGRRKCSRCPIHLILHVVYPNECAILNSAFYPSTRLNFFTMIMMNSTHFNSCTMIISGIGWRGKQCLIYCPSVWGGKWTCCRGELRLKPEPRARSTRELRAKPKSRVKPKIVDSTYFNLCTMIVIDSSMKVLNLQHHNFKIGNSSFWSFIVLLPCIQRTIHLFV